jgi:hypothetical protein
MMQKQPYKRQTVTTLRPPRDRGYFGYRPEKPKASKQAPALPDFSAPKSDKKKKVK